MARNDTGRYICVAFNKHGRSMAETFIDVQCKYKAPYNDMMMSLVMMKMATGDEGEKN